MATNKTEPTKNMTEEEEIDCEYTEEVTCPSCGHVFGDSWERKSDEGTGKCGYCQTAFMWTRNISITYSTEKLEP